MNNSDERPAYAEFRTGPLHMMFFIGKLGREKIHPPGTSFRERMLDAHTDTRDVVIKQITLDENYRRKGIGASVLRHVIRAARRLGLGVHLEQTISQSGRALGESLVRTEWFQPRENRSDPNFYTPHN